MQKDLVGAYSQQMSRNTMTMGIKQPKMRLCISAEDNSVIRFIHGEQTFNQTHKLTIKS